MKGRPQVSDCDRIVNYAEFTAPQRYKDAILDLEHRTGRDKHCFFREALKEYCEKHNVEYFIDAEREEITRREAEIAKMQNHAKMRDQENRAKAEAAARRVLSEQMYLGVKITADYKEKLAEQIATRYQLPPADIKETIKKVYAEFSEKYKDDHRRIFE